MTEIKILQLSDLHLDSSKIKDPQIILNALWKDLDNFKGIDFILFTGDLVKAGDNKDSFEKALQIFIEPLLNKTNVNKDNFFLVPGNHEIQVKAVDDIIEAGLSATLIDRDSLNSFLDKQIEQGFRRIERLEHFYEFKKNKIGTGHEITFNKLFSTHIVEKNSTTIGIACLNSAWRAAGKGGDHDNGKMLIGERQVHECLQDIKDCHIKIALHHHPLDWLTEDDKNHTEDILFREFDFIFCGHLHRGNIRMIKGLEDEVVVIQGGSLYKGRSHYNGYCVLSIDTQKGKGTLHLRTYFDGRNGFDRAIDRCPQGEVKIRLHDDRPGKDKKQEEKEMQTNTKSDMNVTVGTVGGDAKIAQRYAKNAEFKKDESPEENSNMKVKVTEIKGNLTLAKNMKENERGDKK